MKKPFIGVLPLYDENKESYWMLPGYMNGIEETGGIPVMLPISCNDDIINSFAERFDGFLFTGGHDINPKMYNEEFTDKCGIPCDERDEMEKKLFLKCLELDKPVLGICRGMQMFNVALGGSLYKDIPTEIIYEIDHKQKPPYDVPVHQVAIKKNSLIYDVLKRDELYVNSYHHQCIKELSPMLTSCAKAWDGIIEAVYYEGKKFVLGVQWHPEFIYKKDENIRIFRSFVAACKD